MNIPLQFLALVDFGRIDPYQTDSFSRCTLQGLRISAIMITWIAGSWSLGSVITIGATATPARDSERHLLSSVVDLQCVVLLRATSGGFLGPSRPPPALRPVKARRSGDTRPLNGS